MSEWKYYPDFCQDCGNDLEVYTESDEEGFVYDNDPVRCVECGATGIMEIWGDDGDDVRIQWHESMEE